MESLAKRQRELTESNAKILYWAMKTVLGKKKGGSHKFEFPTLCLTQ